MENGKTLSDHAAVHTPRTVPPHIQTQWNATGGT